MDDLRRSGFQDPVLVRADRSVSDTREASNLRMLFICQLIASTLLHIFQDKGRVCSAALCRSSVETTHDRALCCADSRDKGS